MVFLNSRFSLEAVLLILSQTFSPLRSEEQPENIHSGRVESQDSSLKPGNE